MRVNIAAYCEIKPNKHTLVCFQKGTLTIKRVWGEQLVAEGKAKEVPVPRRRVAFK